MIPQKVILPPPKHYEQAGGEPLLLGISGTSFCSLIIKADTSDPQAESAAAMVNEKLKALLNGATGNRIVITLETAEPPKDMINACQGYSIFSDAGKITLTGYGSSGLFYAAVTFCRILSLDGNRVVFPKIKLTDYPDLTTRGHFVESRYGSNLMNFDDWKQVVDNMAMMKMNQLVISVYGCWCVQYDGLVSEYLYIPLKTCPELKTPVVTRYFSPSAGWKDYVSLPPMFEQDFFGELIAYGKTKAVTVLPLFNSYGHNTLIPARYTEVSALEDDGRPSKTGFCTSNPKTYKLLFAIYDEIIERYLKPNQGDSFHIGMDEVWDGIALNAEEPFRTRSTWCRCPECSKKTREELYINHALKLISHLKDKGMKNIYMYNDMLKFAAEANPGEISLARKFASLLREKGLHQVTVMDCWTYSESHEGLSFKSTLPELGLRRTVKPWNGYYHWTLITHPLNNIFMMAEMAHNDNAEGLQSYSSWDLSYQRNNTAEASYSWNFEGTKTNEHFKQEYAGFIGENEKETAVKAFEALEESVNPFNSKYGLMLSGLSYYFHSYVHAGSPYPRRFPGEAISRLLQDRKTSEKMLTEIEASASAAAELFAHLADNPSADYRLAARYVYEAKNYLCLVRDYTALLKMHDLSADLPNMEIAKKIGAIAAGRKAARLTLMALLEGTKEHYLLASHMRNHTIFMQYFADLEGYLKYTPSDSVCLDFTDNTHFASEAFWKLR